MELILCPGRLSHGTWLECHFYSYLIPPLLAVTLAASLAARFSSLIGHTRPSRSFLYLRKPRAARAYLLTFLFSHCPAMLLHIFPSDKPTHLAHLPGATNSQQDVKKRPFALNLPMQSSALSDSMPEKGDQNTSILPLASLCSCPQSLKYHPSPLL